MRSSLLSTPRHRPLVRFGGLALILLPMLLPWQYATQNRLIEIAEQAFTIQEPSHIVYPLDGRVGAAPILYTAIVMAVLIVLLPKWAWGVYGVGGLSLWWAWAGRIDGGPAFGGWEGPSQLLFESGIAFWGLVAYGAALLAVDTFRTSTTLTERPVT